MDKLRVMATCAVVMLHTVSGVIDTTVLEWFSPEMRALVTVRDMVCWCVPVFILISGYLFLDPERKISFWTMLSKYCRRILLALFLFGVPYACLERIAVERTFRIGMLGEAFLLVLQGKSWAHMWYLYLILLLYLLTPAIKWLLARIPGPAVYVLAAALAVGGSILPFLARFFGWEQLKTLPEDSIYFFYYLCGYLFAIHGKERKKKREGGMAARVLPSVILLILAGMFVSRFFETYTVQMAYNYPLTIALSLLLFGWGLTWEKRSCGKADSRFWERTAALTFAVYLIHPVFLNVAYKFLHITPLDFHLSLSLPLFFLGTLLLAFGTAWLLCRIPPLKKYVL